MPLPNVVLPSPYEEERLQTGYSVVQEYRRRYEEEHAKEPWYEDNSWFKHRPNWRENPDFWSIQRVRDKPGPVWTGVAVMFALGKMAFIFGLASMGYLIFR